MTQEQSEIERLSGVVLAAAIKRREARRAYEEKQSGYSMAIHHEFWRQAENEEDRAVDAFLATLRG